MRKTLISMVTTVAFVSTAFAHTGVGQATTFASGIAHPLHGADHIITMLAVGIWAVLVGGRAIVVWPTVFVATMLAGFAAATLGLHVPFVEPAILSSVIILGVLIALSVNAPIWLGAVIIGLFAFFHGHVHGTEATAAGLIPYAAGFAVATAALHVAGIALGISATKSFGKLAIRTLGGAAALAGIALIAT